ncbi:pseudouridine synthase [Arcanobacterium phocae]|uniref:pseudouridine synthase n=1 Tax=Arcanobacterium phocae TaxID=131112 RepID=UPI001C0EB49F|nr:pseudouridine synthase [Arcanobacterium phocae]
MRTPRSVRRARHRVAVRPALRGGINATPVTLAPGSWRTIGEWIVTRFGDLGLVLLDAGDVFADGGREISRAEPYVPGMRLWIFRPVPDEPESPIELNVIADEERFIVVDKPHGMATIPRGSHVAHTVTVAARRQFNDDDLVCAHRLDAETAGLVLLTREPQWRKPYQTLFERRVVGKKYCAITRDIPGFDTWETVELRLERGYRPLATDVVAGEPNSVTQMRIVARGGGLAQWELIPHTGKTHQLRVTLEHVGAPILGDPLYPRLFTKEEEAARAYPLQLHARELSFVDPVDGVERVFTSSARLAQALVH